MRKKWWALPELKESPIFRYRPMENKGKWHEDFGNDSPIYLELGSGMGSFINYLKNTFKDKNFVGIDMEEGCLVYAKRILEEEDTSNVRLVLADTETSMSTSKRTRSRDLYKLSEPVAKKQAAQKKAYLPRSTKDV